MSISFEFKHLPVNTSKPNEPYNKGIKENLFYNSIVFFIKASNFFIS